MPMRMCLSLVAMLQALWAGSRPKPKGWLRSRSHGAVVTQDPDAIDLDLDLVAVA